jgi:uncharacterized protein
VAVLSRDRERARSALGDLEAHTWAEPVSEPAPAQAFSGCDGVINLLGEPLAQAWTDSAKRSIRDSRVLGTRNLVEGLRAVEPPPRVLVSQSASGYYGAHGDEEVDESWPPQSGDFLADVLAEWEEEARSAEQIGMRVVMTRTGLVLSAGGALEKMLPPFKLGIGGPVAGGRQYVPWVHVEDAAGALVHCLDTDSASGPVNVCAPEPVTNAEFSRTLGRVLGRPAVVPVPRLALKVLYGEMAVTVTTGVRMVPRRLEELRYAFQHPKLEEALRSAIGG